MVERTVTEAAVLQGPQAKMQGMAGHTSAATRDMGRAGGTGALRCRAQSPPHLSV